MAETDGSTSSDLVNTIQSLKYLASNVEFFEGNSLLHQIVLDESFTDNSIGKRCLNAVLLSISGASVNELNYEGYSALHLAVLEENVLMVKMLLSCVKNIDVNLKCDASTQMWRKDKNSALHFAADLGNLAIVEALLNHGADANAKNERWQTPLHFAIESRNLECVKVLIGKGAKLNTYDGFQYDSFDYAMKFYCMDIFKELLHRVSELDFLNCDSNKIIRKVASYGNAEALQMLVDRGYNVNALSEILVSPLHLAVKSNNFEAIECLIRNGANVNAVQQNGKSVLHIAGEFCDWGTFKFIFDKCDHVIKNDPTLLHQAARSGNLEKVTFLVNRNSDVNIRDRFGCFPLHEAILSGNSETVSFLLDANADVNGVNGDGKTALYIAVQSANLNIINLLLSKGAELNVENKDFPLLCCAAQTGNLAVVELILEQCANVNVEDKYRRTPLYLAVIRNHVEVIKALLDRGANIDAENTAENPLHTAVYFTKTDAAQVLLERGCKVNAKDDRGYTPIIYALENYVMLDSDVINLLIKWGAVIEGSPRGNTILHYACLMTDFKPDILNSVLEVSTDVCTANVTGKTPLHFAAKRNNVGALKLLVEKGADLNAKDVKGDTPLHYAARQRNAKFVKALLKRRAEVNVKGLHGRTPLHTAVINFDDDIIKALLYSGANVDIVDDSGKTAHHYEEEPLLGTEGASEDDYESLGDTEDEYEPQRETEDEYENEGDTDDEPL